MSSVAKQLTALTVVDNLAHASLPAALTKLTWATDEGTWNTTFWSPVSFSKGHLSGLYYNTESGKNAVGFKYVEGSIANAEREAGVWLAKAKEEKAAGYQLTWFTISSGTEVEWRLLKWVGGESTTLATWKTTYATGDTYFLTLTNGKLQAWRWTKSEGLPAVMGEATDTTFKSGLYGVVSGNGSNPHITNLYYGSVEEEGAAEDFTTWTYILCKLDGTPIGELRNATERSFTVGLNRPAVASCTITVSNELLPNLFGEDTLLQIWEDKTLRFYGYVLTPELAAGEQMPGTVKLNAADPAWRLTRRILGKSKGGTKFSGDKAESTKKMIDELNTGGETGIKTQVVSSGSSGEYVAGPYKEALTCINDLAHGFDGFDWYISPVDGAEPKLGLYEADPTFGEERKNTVFEFGWGQNNIRSLTYLRDKSNLTNRAFHLPDDGLETAEVLSKEDATSIAAHGLFEEVTDGFGLVDTTLRNKWLEQVIAVKKNPRFVAGMTLDFQDDTGRVPKVGTDFWLGDIVQARAVVENMTLFNGKVRVYQIKFDINDNGTATVTPILIEEGA